MSWLLLACASNPARRFWSLFRDVGFKPGHALRFRSTLKGLAKGLAGLED